MSFEKPTPEPVSQHVEITPDVNRENIINGRGFEEIENVGWQKYRETLADMSYGDIVERQAEEVERLASGQDYKTGKLPEWIIEKANSESSQRATEMATWFTQEYGKEKSATFTAFKDREKKLIARGKDIPLTENGEPVERPVTRLYFSVPTKNAPEIFKEVFTALADEGEMRKVDLALNLESYQSDSLKKESESNTIVLYTYGKDSQLMESIAKSVRRAKNASPDKWEMSRSGKGKAKETMIKEFLIPLDENVAFAEMPNLESYHANAYGRISEEVTGIPPYMKVPLKEFTEKVKTFTSRFRNAFTDFPNRRRNMPALIID
jgi:hypothetical protein